MTNNKIITIEKNLNGSLILKCDSYKMIYYGYSKTDALKMFKRFIKLKGGVK